MEDKKKIYNWPILGLEFFGDTEGTATATTGLQNLKK